MSTITAAFVFAHPDDESFGSAALIRQLADAGHRVVLLCATKGDAGQTGPLGQMSRAELAERRVHELDAAARILGIETVEHLGYPDGGLADVPSDELTAHVVDFLKRHEARIVVTFPEDGGNRHRDHIAISAAATRAVTEGNGSGVSKLYYFYFGAASRPGGGPTVRLDTEPYWEVKCEALRAHESQRHVIANYFGNLTMFPVERRWESFALAWDRGRRWPDQPEHSALEMAQVDDARENGLS